MEEYVVPIRWFLSGFLSLVPINTGRNNYGKIGSYPLIPTIPSPLRMPGDVVEFTVSGQAAG